MARYYQNLYNHGKKLEKQNENIGRVANYLEEFMEQISETFLNYEKVQSLLIQDKFHEFIRMKIDLIYKESLEKYGHLISKPKYHSEFGSTDITNPDMLYDDYLIHDTDL